MGNFPTHKDKLSGNFSHVNSIHGSQTISRARTAFFTVFCACLPALAGVAVFSGAAGAADDIPTWLEGELQLGVGVDYSRGDYEESLDTEIVFVPFSLTMLFDGFALTPTERDQVELKVVVPLLHIDGAITAGSSESEEETGLGDVIVGASYLYYPRRTLVPAVELKVNVKIPTADEDDGLGTGKTDVGLGATLFQRYGDLVPFVSGGYRFIGENEPDYALRNGATAGAGVSWIFTPRYSIGASYDWRQAISKRTDESSNLVRADDSHELTFFGSARIGGGLRVAPYTVIGLSDGSPDYAVGLQLSVGIPIRNPPPSREPFGD